MPNSAIAKTVLAHKRHAAVLLFGAGFVLAAGILFFRSPEPSVLEAGSQRFELETVTTEGKRQLGLSGRQSLERQKGMLLIFGSQEGHCIWMKGMRFALDIIWADAGRRVVHLEQGIAPDTYPQTFCSETPALYVIELSSGSIERAGIRQGQILNF